MAVDNNLLSKFTLTGIPPAPKGVSVAKVCFNIDADGILKCSALDISTGNKSEITITDHSGRLPKEAVERMLRDAEMYKVADEQYRQKIRAIDVLLSYVQRLATMLKRHGKKVGRKDERKMGDAIEHTKQWADWNYVLLEACKFEEKLKELESICEPIITKMIQSEKHGVKLEDDPVPKMKIIDLD